MLHELILALNGCDGDIFCLRDGAIKVANELRFLHPTEEALLNRVCKLATHYVAFMKFLSNYANIPDRAPTGKLYGLYIRAFCKGLEEVLHPYRQRLVLLERELLADPQLTVGYIQSSLDEFQDLFPVIASVIKQIELHKVHGCNLLELLHREAAGVTAKASSALLRIQFACHCVMYRQLAAWMLHGLLLDKYGEFFIQATATAALSVEDDAKTVFEEHEEDLGLVGGVTTKQLNRALQLAGYTNDKVTQTRFSLRSEMLPSYLPTRIAEKILFVGESIQIFESASDSRQRKQQENILKEKEDEFLLDLHQLSQEAIFNLMNFESTIDKIRTYVSERLWKLVVKDAELVKQLRTMKEFFLLGRGELFLDFIDKASHLLQSAPILTTEHDVNAAFQQSAHNVLLDDDKLLQKLGFKIPFKATDKNEEAKARKPVGLAIDAPLQKGENGWNSMTLTYDVEWPIHILLTPVVIERYNILFRFLLLVKRVELELQRCWALQMQRRHSGHGTLDSNAWWLRNCMAFIINNLQYYLQVDVIESQFTVLLDKINSTRDFETIRHAQDTFISTLLSQSFLLTKPVNRCLHEILELCHQFHVILVNSEIHLTDQEKTQLENVAKEFQRQSNLLFTILSAVRNHQSNPHLMQLLLRLDYNKYFTQAGGQLGSFVSVRKSPDGTLSSGRH